MSEVTHAFSVDVEDWFQVLNMAGIIDRARWDDFELRCGDSTRRLLELLDRRQVKGTFFCLGWIAERLPDLIAEIHAAGHEVGSHGYDHRCLHDLGEAGFDEDLALTENALRGITGQNPTVFRACTWSITRRTPWALDVLARRGYRIDSSIQPVRHPDYGVPGAPTRPYRVRSTHGDLLEFPPLTLRWAGRHLPVGGGGYLRLFPLGLLRRGLRQAEREGLPGCIYVHPWEVDPEQPRQELGGVRGFRHYVNLRKTLTKLDRLLAEFRFGTVTDALGNGSAFPERVARDLLGSEANS